MKQLLITIAAVVLVGCGKSAGDVKKSKENAIAGNAKCIISHKYRDGNMLLKVKAFPFKGTIEKTLKQQGDSFPGAHIAILFKDEDGFEIFEQKVYLKNMNRFGEYVEQDIKTKMTIEKYNLVARGKYHFGRTGFVE